MSRGSRIATVQDALARIFGHADFRPGQQEIDASVLAGEDVLAVMPTGAGKSLLYQLPAVAGFGPVVVVSPLISLMRDQITAIFMPHHITSYESSMGRIINALRPYGVSWGFIQAHRFLPPICHLGAVPVTVFPRPTPA